LISPAICEAVHALPIYFWTISIAQEDKQAGHHLLQSVVMRTCVIFMHLVSFFLSYIFCVLMDVSSHSLNRTCRFSLPEKKVGSLFNEKFKKNQHTVPNTAAHSLRIELAAKLEEKFDSIETAFEYYSEGLCPLFPNPCAAA
jgi:hypothetical protein